jgi:uncharacterized phiE125 gp8 family phage protein
MEDIVLVTAPKKEPVTLKEFKDHGRITDASEDDYIANILIPAARSAVEDELHRVLVTQTWKLRLDGFPGYDTRYEQNGYPVILLPKPPFQKIVSFKYVDVAGVTQTLAACNADGTAPAGQMYGYQLDPGSETQPARLTPPWAKPWPPSRRKPMAVEIVFDCGYGGIDTQQSPAVTLSPALPPVIKAAILHTALTWFENRELISTENKNELPHNITLALSRYVNHIA